MGYRRYNFQANTPLKVEHFNSFLQDSQIVHETGDSNDCVMSQSAVSRILKNFEYGYGINFSSIYYATGKVDNGVLVACAENKIGAVTDGTTVIVKMGQAYRPNLDCAKLRAGDKQAEIRVIGSTDMETNLKRKIYYSEVTAYYSSYICARNIFIEGASYEFYYDGEYWILKNYVISCGKNHRIWADGFTEQWGERSINTDQTAVINFSHPYSGDNYLVLYSGRRAYTTLSGTDNHPGIGVKSKTRNSMILYEDVGSCVVNWYVCGY